MLSDTPAICRYSASRVEQLSGQSGTCAAFRRTGEDDVMHLTTAAQQQWVGAADSSLDDSGLRSKETESETHEELVIARSM